MIKIRLLFITVLLFITQLYSQISLTGSGLYTQDFNTLTSSGTSSVIPAGWSFSESGGGANSIYTADNGSNSNGDTYSYGAAGSGERALGGLRLSGFNIIFGAGFINNTGSTITQVPVTYAGEQWRLGASGRIDYLDFQYSIDATRLTDGNWIDVNNLDFNAPISSGTAGALDGNAASNRASVSYTLTGLNIPNGSTFWIRWLDDNASGLDDGLAVDDFQLNEASLPVELSSFTASVQSNIVNLKWQTKIEVNNYGFEVLRSSKNNNNWVTIGFVNGTGNSNSPKDYNFTDRISVSGKFIYRLKQIDTDGRYEYSKEVGIDLGLPGIYSLGQNYPNPFNPTTTITYALLQPGNVTLKVFDVLGREVAALVNEFKREGRYTIQFDASSLSSGIYFYRLQAVSFVQTKKMVIAK